VFDPTGFPVSKYASTTYCKIVLDLLSKEESKTLLFL